ncbi:MAG TPA: ABC transporter substrate-binding protein [Candidatus Obscuribacterales bacterium]
MPKFVAAIAATTVAIISAACSCAAFAAADGAEGEKIGVTDSEIVIGTGLPFTGKLGWRGPAISHAVSALFNDVNEHGGVNGRKLKLVTCDDGYEPEKAVACFNTTLKDKVFAAGFFTGSPTNAKYVRMADANKMPVFGFLVGTPIIYEYSRLRFTLRPSYAQEIERHVAYLWNTHHLRRFGIVYQSDAFGAGVRTGTVTALKQLNSAPISEASYSRDQNDVTSALTELMKTKPEVVIMGTSSGEVKACVEFRNSENWRPVFLFLSSQDDAVIKCGKMASGCLVSQVLPELDESLPAAVKYQKLLKKYYPTDEPKVAGFEAFVNAEAMVEALKRGGKDLTRSSFVQAAEGMHNLDIGLGANYLVHFSPGSHVGWSGSAIYLSEVIDGKLAKATDAKIADAAKQAISAAK